MEITRLFSITTLIPIITNVLCHENQNQKFAPGVPPPDQHVHTHGNPVPGEEGTGRNRLMQSVQDEDHILNHMDGVMNKPKDQMTPEELQFYYFKLHDYDNNNKLDGTELIKAITHFHNEDNKNVAEQAKVFSDDEIDEIVRMVLKQDDINNDGYIEYAEFMSAQSRAPQPDEHQPEIPVPP